MITEIGQILKAALNNDAYKAKAYAELIVQKYYDPSVGFNEATTEQIIARIFNNILNQDGTIITLDNCQHIIDEPDAAKGIYRCGLCGELINIDKI